MRRIKKISAVTLCALFLIFILPLSVSAEGASPLLSMNAETVSKSVPVSYGLDVIAHDNAMAIAGIKGNALNFSAERFACAMNLAKVDYITVTSLPSGACGSLYIGSEGVSVGQKINAADIALMTYEEAEGEDGSLASFDFTVNGSAYQMTCNIYMIDEINYSPTVSLASAVSLNAETYRGVKISGVLSAYDPEGDSLVFEIARYPSHGRVVIEDRSCGTYTYIPEDSYTGSDSFSYVVRDKYGNYSAAAEVELTVSAQGTSTVYRDLVDDELHAHAIAMTECGLMNGVQVGDHYYFEADREVSRAEFIVTAMNALGIKNLPDVDETVFFDDSDINPEMKSYISLAYSKGYISGSRVDGNLCFKPDETIKLSEAAVIISNMIGYAEPKVAPAFADADSIPSWSEKAIESLHTLGIIETPDKVVGATETITRGDMAKLLNKMMQVIGR